MNNKYIFSLTTIPSRVNNIESTIKSLLDQTLKPEKIVLNIPKKYNIRFESVIDEHTINTVLSKYIDQIVVNYIEQDYGPGTKLLGLIKSNVINLDLKNTYIVLVDDDMIYKPYMLECFSNYNSEKHADELIAASFHCYKSKADGFVVGQGADGFFMKLDYLHDFNDYYAIIQDKDYVNYHDDYYISYYFHIKQFPIQKISLPDNKFIWEANKNHKINSLSRIKDKYSGRNLRREVNKVLYDLNKEGKFDAIKND